MPFGAAGGATGELNLGSLDVRTHQFKTARTWSVAINRRRDLRWCTLLGQTATTRVHDYRQYLERAVPATGTGPETWESRRDLACQALYAALVHRGADAFLSDRDDDADDGTPLTGWCSVARRRTATPVPTPEEVLGIRLPVADCTQDEEGEHGTTGGAGRGDAPGAPWSSRETEPPPF